MYYRQEIDGLRAFALLPVLFFHAGFETFSGGFVGVDVFFVISGYLITSTILSELEQGKFSIFNFYERRARRILPAMFLVMLVCIPIAWFWLLPIELKDFSQSLVATSVFSSNIFFWYKVSYFDSAAELKPLLHTWSLAVEEQFYVLFPIYLVLVWKFDKRLILITLGLIFLTSFMTSQWAVNAKPSAAFYLLPTRGWELLIGAFTAFYLSKVNRKEFNKITSEVGGWLGIALILYAVFTYKKTTPFPGLYALVPTLGTALIILFTTKHTTAGKFVGNKLLAGIGLISYSAYLWHQPLFAFVKLSNLPELFNFVSLLIPPFTLFLAYFSWKYVEEPFRKSDVITRRKFFALSFFFTVLFVSVGYLGNEKNGFETRFNRVLSGDIGHIDFHKYIDSKYLSCEPKSIADRALNWEGFIRCKQSKNGIPDIILLGDSHAEHLFLGLAESIPNKNVAFYILIDKPYFDNNEFKHIFDEILYNNKFQHIILTMHFMGRLDAKGTGLYEGFSTTINELLKVGKSVTLVGDVPRFSQDPGLCAFSFSVKSKSSCFLSLEDAERQRMIYDGILKRLGNEFELNYLRIDEDICSKNGCVMYHGDNILYRDNNHLNIIGSRQVGKSLAEKLPL
jgi:peptidoglycan/LPS O-acetylase OafA/YrhL